jgi:hypothetical protein
VIKSEFFENINQEEISKITIYTYQKVRTIVNFNNETTITRPKQDIVTQGILERRQELLNELRDYKKVNIKRSSTTSRASPIFLGCLYSFIQEIEPMLDNEWSKIKNNPFRSIEDIYVIVENNSEEDVLKVWKFINKFLYTKGIIKTDTRKDLDRADILLMNEEANM